VIVLAGGVFILSRRVVGMNYDGLLFSVAGAIICWQSVRRLLRG